uniref:Nuclear pore complex protein Nup98-Nup96 n=2 Tax=Hirondellea gigas TaxID=1518452 RepID=A0A6A7FXC8_9CRUS
MFGSRPPFSGTSSFTGFGATNNAQQTTGFGTGTFGRSTTFGTQPTENTGFGSTATSSTPFGGAGTTGTSLFGTAGQPNTNPGAGLFGTSNTGAFGSNTTGGLFGTQNTAAAPSTGLFGIGANTNNAFNAQPKAFGTPVSSTTGGLFNTAATGTGLFGANTGTNIVGTTIKYQPVTGTDTMTRNGVTSNIQTRIAVITCMKEYEGKSLEELRVEDYIANRKGPGQTGALMTGGFGSGTTGGVTAGGLFGSTAPAGQLGAANTGGLFGQKPQETKPLFGTAATNTGFGVSASSNTGGLFGNTTTAPAFGQAPTSTGTGFNFGQNTQNQNKTGFSFPISNTASNTTTGGLFGQQTQQQPNQGFSATNTGFSFGQTATSQQNQTGLFNQAKPAAFGSTAGTSGGGLFGGKPAAAPAFGGFGTGTTGFGTSAAATPFGTNTNTNTAGGLFGNTQNKPAFGLGNSTFGNTFNTGTSGGGLFGNTGTNTGGGLFGSNTMQQNKPAGGLSFNTGNTFNTGTNTLGLGLNNNSLNKPTGFGAMGGGFGTMGGLGATNNMSINNTVIASGIGDNNIANLIKALTDNPFGHSSLLKTPMATTGKADELLSPPSDSSKQLGINNNQPPTYVLPSKLPAAVQPRAHVTISSTASSSTMLNNRSLLFAGLDDTNEGNGGDEIFKTKSFPSVKKLNLKVFKNLKSGAGSPLVGQSAGSGASSPTVEGGGRSPLPLTTPLHRGVSPASATASPALHANNSANDSNTATPEIIKGRSNMKRISLAYKKGSYNDTLADLNVACRGVVAQQVKDGVCNTSSANDKDANNTSVAGNTSQANFSLYEAPSQDVSEAELSASAQPHPTGIKLSRSGYYTIPSLSELVELIDEDGRCCVENFSVGREGYGNVCFSSETDVIGLDLDSTVFIVRKELEVYPDAATKPKVGEALNKPAVITLDAVWPIDKSSRDVIKDNSRLEAMGWPRYLEKKCLNMGAKFLEYRPDTGSWVFKVNHFSKYGLQDDNDDEFSPEDLIKAQKQMQQQQQQVQQNKRVSYDLDPSGNNLPKTVDPSLIKSSSQTTSKQAAAAATARISATSAAAGALNNGSNDGGADGSITTNTTSSGSLSSSSSGLGGAAGTTTTTAVGGAGGGPPTLGLVVSPPPTHHLLPHLTSASGASQYQKQVSRGVRSSSTAPATVPGELFLDSFANEPDEGASLGAPYLPGGGAAGPNGSGSNKTLKQLTTNMFPMEEEEDLQDLGSDGYSDTGTMMLGSEHAGSTFACGAGAATAVHRLIEDSQEQWRESSIKKFPSKVLECVEESAGMEGRLSPSIGEHTIVKPKLLPHAKQQRDLSSPSSAYRASRTEYPSMVSVGSQVNHPPVVAPMHSGTVLPLPLSLLHRQQNNISDAAAFRGVSFRVGWGPSWQLLHTGNALGTQVDVVGAAAARDKRAAAAATMKATSVPYLFMPSSSTTTTADAASHQHNVLHTGADLPKYEVKLEKLHLTDLSAASLGSPDPATALRTVEACLYEVLHCSTASSVGSRLAARHMQPSSGRTLLHRLAGTVQQLQRSAEEDDSSDCCSSQLSDVLELCMALWGKLDYGWLEDAAAESEYVQARARVETVSQWVERVCSAGVRREVQAVMDAAAANTDNNSADSHLEAVFSHLTAREIHNACDLLQEKGDHHLALLLAQVCMGDDTPRQIIAKQLANWAECGADTTMSPSRLVLYVLASGQATYNSGSGLVNICKGLDWRRALAVHLWYICPSTCTVSEALLEYERGAGLVQDSLSPSSSYCQEPLPQYLGEHTLPDSVSRVSYDICYHLLKLYTQPSYRLDQLLNPATNTPDPLDVTTSWLVMALIHSLGYTHVNPIVANGIHLAMAAHLESAGLWHWAIFVLLSLKQENCRGAEVRSVLSRHVQIVEGIESEDDTFVRMKERQRISDQQVVAAQTMEVTGALDDEQQQPQANMDEDDVGFVDGDDNSMDTDLTRRNEQQTTTPQPAENNPADEDSQCNVSFNDNENEINFDLSSYLSQEEFLIAKLRIPEKWINESKAILARSLGMVEEEAWYLIKAGDLTRAHALLIETIAPTAIINEDHDYLARYITAFEASSPSLLDVNVPDWKIGGAVYAHYLHILAAVEEIKRTQQPTQDKVEALRPRLLALCGQLNSLRTPTARHRLCVSEVSRVVVGVLRAVLGEDLAATAAIANQVASLPLSQDCALQELNTLTHQYLAAVAN